MSSEAKRGPVAGVLLAAGTSSRMGRNKLLLDAGGEPLVRRSARQALDGGLAPLLVVVGHEQDLVRQALAGLPCEIVVNPDYEEGIVTSLRAGLRAVPASVNAAMVLLADMPFVTPAMISTLIAGYEETTAPLVISDYEEVTAPPMVYDRSLFAELEAMDDGRCGRQVVRRHRDEAEVVAWPRAALADVDTPDDVAQLDLASAEA